MEIFTPAPSHLTVASWAPNARQIPRLRGQSPNENDSLETSSRSDEVGLQAILPHPSLRFDERQHIFERRLHKLV